MKLLTAASLLTSLLTQTVTAADQTSFPWPQNQQAAIVLTYDDTLDSHLDIALPQLNQAGLKATFYISGARGELMQRMDEWRKAADQGHELGNHTLYHPCKASKPNREWVQPYNDLDQYSLKQFEEEIKVTNVLLHAIDGKSKRTFAYTCGETELQNNQSMIPALENWVTAARAGSPPLPFIPPAAPKDLFNGLSDPRTINRYKIKSMDASGQTAEQLISAAKSARKNNQIMTFLFHGITDQGEYLTVSPKAHQALIDHLKKNQDTYWVAPMQEVVDHMNKIKQ